VAETSARKPKNPVAVRLTVAPLLLAGIVGLLYWHHSANLPAVSHVMLGLFGGVAVYEFCQLLRRRDEGVALLIPCVAAVLLGAAELLPDGTLNALQWRVLITIAAVFAIVLRSIKDLHPEAVETIARAILPVAFVALPFSLLGALGEGPDGAMRLLYIVVGAKASDMGGWLVGKPFGKHKILPTVSPGKSYEGGVGAIVASVACTVFLAAPLGLDAEASQSMAWRVGLGVMLAVTSLLAGFFWSGFKRRLGAKDSSTLIPEMGGVMDLVDSLVVAAPAAWVWYALSAA